jgi:hypothetical protein
MFTESELQKPTVREINTGRKDGRGDWIRTSDRTPPRRVRYQAALRPDTWETPFLL